uniref:uncharacterized protein C6orf141 homolog n=1 Tax=Jaculus jaculus TaxID=51337 RepID=UPI001E1B11FC|nr:uncharacterized protein C6orf141 homolog [Jaculus jaculus]
MVLLSGLFGWAEPRSVEAARPERRRVRSPSGPGAAPPRPRPTPAPRASQSLLDFRPGPVNDPPCGMEFGRPPRPAVGARSFLPREGRASPLAPGAPIPAQSQGGSGSLGGGNPDFASPAGGNVECAPWVREKVLFLLHPERWMGTPGDPACAEGPRGEDLPQVSRDHEDGGAGGPPRAPGARPREPAAPARPVFVRVVDYQVTREVLRTAGTTGRATTRTEERCVTAVTFRTQRH